MTDIETPDTGDAVSDAMMFAVVFAVCLGATVVGHAVVELLKGRDEGRGRC